MVSNPPPVYVSARDMTAPRTLFIGDVHGCAGELDELLGRLALAPGDRALLTGDAFSRGPDPRRVWDVIRATGAAMVLGNHDDRLLRQLRRHRDGRELGFKHDDQRRTFEALAPVFDALHPWLESLPLYIDADRFLLVHAGIDPGAGLAGTSRDQFLAIRLWPPADGIDGPRWHEAAAPLPDRVLVFGHDAPGGLVVKRRAGAADGLPWLVGLDSGCIYGGQLSAWILEEDRLVQVDSRQDSCRWLP